MIRPITCVCVLLAGASGLYLYQSKHRVQLLDKQIEATVHATQAARERTGVLRAEWTLLNDPERLAQLADRFLALKTVAPPQFTTTADLGNRLPPVKIPDPEAPDVLPAEPATDQIALAPEASPTQPKPAPVVIAAKPEPKPAPKVVAAAKPERPADKTAERPAERAAERKPAQLALNTLQPPPAQRVATRSLIAPAVASVPVGAPVPLAAPIRAAYTPSAVRHVPVDSYSGSTVISYPAPMAPSALGAVRSSLPPPVPYAQPNGN